ncbi:MAG TPA: NAD(P)/FAD-dependent oxidoreductase [Tepidiformaceae bacterium]|nr:NAD(P)/FAD-dependent oxidoreductase [Tepidiformaceae bacterium]
MPWDAVVVGSGPNGLAAAITIARAGRRVLVLEAKSSLGGGSRTAELTLPGFRHDVCSAIHPLGAASPFFRSLRLERFGLEWLHPEVLLAHPLEGGRAGVMYTSLEETAAALGPDGGAYRRLLGPLVRQWPALLPSILGPVLRVPRHPLAMARFGLAALQPATWLIRRFETDEARGLFAGQAAHAMVPLDSFQTSSFGLVLAASAHSAGWPVAKGGSQAIVDALAACLRSLGGEIECDRPVRTLDDLPPARAYLFDVTPRQLLRIAGSRLGGIYRRQLEGYRYGPGVFKLDYALSGPMPWTNPEARRAGTVHVGGTVEEMAEAEHEVGRGYHPEHPLVLVAQQSVADPSRAPAGQHTLWAYCHVPNGSTFDMTGRIERQIDRFAPGWRDLILARATMGTGDYERYNPNDIGGDIGGGASDGLQLLFRPVPRLNPYRTSLPGVYLCSSSTPPGGGVHGMCGYRAARAALGKELR